ncbi:hypothetical protein PZA11_004218 [Diplocarpon coronariae]|uniref:Uncharacterized protein n=1 Tax=Diplocarpon coronariae TaxID=2795749 RepID=A0A218Z6H2_9HELO|nr:hypothetical protein JHW43_000984 [Diplocarpon mali]OWP03681.1 hypothetical protein B2J93_2193 [Marssonina coronariae]
METRISSTEVLGSRLLREIAAEDGSLEDLLKDLRTACIPNPPRTGISDLDSLWKTRGGRLSITGRTLPLLHHILTHLVSPHHMNGTIALLDLTGRFSPSHLISALSVQDLRHIHVFRPTTANLQVTLDSVEKYMLYGEHKSQGREWLGTIVNGGVGGDINLGWSGWLRVEREEVCGFGVGVSIEEVWGERNGRQEVVDGKGWRAECREGGSFLWQ